MNEYERMRELARLREKALHDEVSALSSAREEERAEIVVAMRKSGISEEMIKTVMQNVKKTGDQK